MYNDLKKYIRSKGGKINTVYPEPFVSGAFIIQGESMALKVLRIVRELKGAKLDENKQGLLTLTLTIR